VSVEHGFDGEQERVCACVVECEGFGGSMALRENPEGLEHADVAVHGVPHDADHGCKRGHEERKFLGDYADVVHEHEDWDRCSDADHKRNEKYACTFTKHEGSRVGTMLLHLFWIVANIFTLPKRTLVQNVSSMPELLVYLVQRCCVEAAEVCQNVAFRCHSCNTGNALGV
jgi:hypothetical protein